MHDGWTLGGCHYIGFFALYVPEAQGVRSITAPLLSMSLMNSCSKCDKFKECDYTSEATEFDAGTHAKHIKDVLALYCTNFNEWCFCQTADNCNSNQSVAIKLRIPHVVCSSHRLNLEIGTWSDLIRR